MSGLHTDLEIEQEIKARLSSVSGGIALSEDSDSDDELDTAARAYPLAPGGLNTSPRHGLFAALAQLGKGNKLIAEASGLLLAVPDSDISLPSEASSAGQRCGCNFFVG